MTHVVFLSNFTMLIRFCLPLQVEKSCGIPEEEDSQTIMLSQCFFDLSVKCMYYILNYKDLKYC